MVVNTPLMPYFLGGWALGGLGPLDSHDFSGQGFTSFGPETSTGEFTEFQPSTVP